METLKQFETGKTYGMRFVTDSDLVVPVKVISRTAKTLKLQVRGEGVITKGVKVYNNEETCLPLGSYSMAPYIKAGRLC